MSILQKQYHDELKLELQGTQYPSIVDTVKQNDAVEESLSNLLQITEDADNMSKVVMPRRKRKLYEAMQVSSVYVIEMHA